MKTRPITMIGTLAFGSSRPDRLAAEALAAALSDDPFYAAIALDAIDRREALIQYFEYSVWEGRQLGTVVVPIGDPPGAAVWTLPQPSDVMEQAQQAKHAAFATLLGPRGLDTYQAILAFMEPIARTVIPDGSWYLSILGVAPHLQGRGLGRTLLEPTLSEADRNGVRCYLETYNAASLRFYARLGFRDVAENLEPTINARYWIMLREPQSCPIVFA
jgi:ribosomal protein S18 acetylase RimI-like enzyme